MLSSTFTCYTRSPSKISFSFMKLNRFSFWNTVQSLLLALFGKICPMLRVIYLARALNPMTRNDSLQSNALITFLTKEGNWELKVPVFKAPEGDQGRQTSWCALLHHDDFSFHCDRSFPRFFPVERIPVVLHSPSVDNCTLKWTRGRKNEVIKKRKEILPSYPFSGVKRKK